MASSNYRHSYWLMPGTNNPFKNSALCQVGLNELTIRNDTSLVLNAWLFNLHKHDKAVSSYYWNSAGLLSIWSSGTNLSVLMWSDVLIVGAYVQLLYWLNSFISKFLTKYKIIKQKWTYTHNHIQHVLCTHKVTNWDIFTLFLELCQKIYIYFTTESSNV